MTCEVDVVESNRAQKIHDEATKDNRPEFSIGSAIKSCILPVVVGCALVAGLFVGIWWLVVNSELLWDEFLKTPIIASVIMEPTTWPIVSAWVAVGFLLSFMCIEGKYKLNCSDGAITLTYVLLSIGYLLTLIPLAFLGYHHFEVLEMWKVLLVLAWVPFAIAVLCCMAFMVDTSGY